MAKDDSNWTQWAASVGAFGAAAGYSAYAENGRGSASDVLRNMTNPIIHPVMTSQQNLIQRTLRNVIASRGDTSVTSEIQQRIMMSRLSRLEGQLSKQASIPGMSQAIAREWEIAKNAVLPTGMEMRTFSIHPGDPFGGVRNALSQSSSIYTQGVFNKFASNVETLSRTGQFGNLSDLSTRLSIPEHLKPRAGMISDPTLRGYAGELSQVLGENVSVKYKGRAGSGEYIFSLPDHNKPLFTLPEAFGPEGMQKGIVRTGAGLHNIYAPGMFSSISEAGELGSPVTFTDFKAQQMIETARNAINKGIPLEAAMASRSAEINKLMDFMEPSLDGQDFSLQTIAKSQRLTVVDEAGSVIKGLKAQQVLERNSMLTPTSTAGRFQTLSPDDIYGGFTESIDFARKPGQWIKEYRPTAEAQKAIMETQYGTKMYDFLDSPMAIKQFNGPSGPRLKTLYLSDAQMETLKSLGFPVGDGELLVNKQFQNQAEVTRTRRVALKEISDDLTSKLLYTQTQGGLPDVGDYLLGRGTSGQLISGKQGERIKDISPVALDGPGRVKVPGYNVVLEETIKMGEFEKKFGGLKGMARAVSFDSIAESRSIQELIGLSSSELKQFGAIGRLSDISASKDPALRAMQQFSAVVTEAEANPGSAAAQELLQDPRAVMSRINKSGNVTSQIESLAENVGITRGTKSFDRIFGDEAVHGVTRVNFGGSKEFTGAGKMGTIEPRILTMLEGQAEGFGQELGEDLVGRVLQSDPDRMGVHNELRKTFASMVEGAKTPEGVNLNDLDGSGLANLRSKGGYIKTGIPSMPNLYMPGYDSVSTLAPFKVGEDMVETSPIKKTFREIERVVRDTTAGKLDAEDAMEAFTNKGGFFNQLFQEFAPGGKGQGSMARGQVYGSRFLTAVSGKSKFYQQVSQLGLQEAPVIGIPKSIGLQMIQELTEQGIDTAEMMTKFEAGEAIGGAVARHPFIGAYSMQPVKMLATDAAEPVMYVPEAGVSARIKGMPKPVNLVDGILQGLGLDKDADIPMAVALNKQMEEQVRTQIGKKGTALDAQMQSYSQHSARMQLLKAGKGANAGELTRSQQVAAAGTKLGITDEYVGRVSSQLSTARSAVIASSLDESSKVRSLGLLEWLEQQPISGKHLTAENVLSGSFQKQMEAVISGASGDSKLLTNTVRNMVASEPDPMKRKIHEGILGAGLELEQPITLAGQELKSIQGFELEKTSQQISEAVKSFQTTKSGDMTKAQIEKYMRPGRMAGISRQQIPSMLEASDMARAKASSGLKEAQKQVLAGINKVASEVKSRVRPFAKPLMLGIAAAGAASFAFSGSPEIMSEPRTSGRTGAMPPNQAIIGRSNRDDISIPEPGRQVLGEPTTPNMISNRSVMLDENQSDRSRDMRMRISAQNISNRQRQELSSRLNSRFPGTLDINVQDSRRSMSKQNITDMLD